LGVSQKPSRLKAHNFTPVSNAHSIRTRASQASLVVPRYRSLVGKGTFKYTGTIAWNNLPLGVQSSLKKTVKSHLLNKCEGF